MLLEAFQHGTVGRRIHVNAGQNPHGNTPFGGEMAKRLSQGLAAEVEHSDIHAGTRLLQFGDNQRDAPTPGRKGDTAGNVPVNEGGRSFNSVQRLGDATRNQTGREREREQILYRVFILSVIIAILLTACGSKVIVRWVSQAILKYIPPYISGTGRATTFSGGPVP